MTYLDILRDQLIFDEGVRHLPYQDSVGKTSIGVGRNLNDVGVSGDEIALMLTNDIRHADDAARSLIPNFDELSDARKAVVVNMAFQLGRNGLAEFQNTLRNIREGRWEDAAKAMLSSKVAQTQAPARWERHVKKMREG